MENSYGRVRSRTQRWFWFSGWLLTGAVLMASLADASVGGPGIVLVPVGITSVILLITKGPRWPEMLGGVTGMGLLFLLIAYFNREYGSVCSGGQPVVRRTTDGQLISVSSCPFESPGGWLVLGLFLVVTGLGGYVSSTGGAMEASKLLGNKIERLRYFCFTIVLVPPLR